MLTLPDAAMLKFSTPGPKVTEVCTFILVRLNPATSNVPCSAMLRVAVVVGPFWSSDPATEMPLPKMLNPPENDTSLIPACSSRLTPMVVCSNCMPPRWKAPIAMDAVNLVVGATCSDADTSTVVPSTLPSNAIWKPGVMGADCGDSWQPSGARMNSK